MDKSDFQTRSSYGTIGLDFNKGFVTLSETNQYGHLVDTQFLPYRFKSGNKTSSDLEVIAIEVVKRASDAGKDLCIETWILGIKRRIPKVKWVRNIMK